MTAAIAHTLRATADRAAVASELAFRAHGAAREAWRNAAIRIAEAVAESGTAPEPLVAAYADARANWLAARDVCHLASARESEALASADAAERELAHANPFVADEEAWRNERALQEAQTEKEACHA